MSIKIRSECCTGRKVRADLRRQVGQSCRHYRRPVGVSGLALCYRAQHYLPRPRAIQLAQYGGQVVGQCAVLRIELQSALIEIRCRAQIIAGMGIVAQRQVRQRLLRPSSVRGLPGRHGGRCARDFFKTQDGIDIACGLRACRQFSRSQGHQRPAPGPVPGAQEFRRCERQCLLRAAIEIDAIGIASSPTSTA